MDALVSFTIPVKGLGPGIHQYNYKIDQEFFSHFESSPVREAKMDLLVTFDKRTDMYLFAFEFKGTVKSSCDRCLADINLPIEGRGDLIVKIALETQEEDADVIFVHPETQKFNVATHAYEYMILAIPMIKVFDCEAEEAPPCNDEMLDYLEDISEENNEEEGNLPFKDVLKNWNPEKEK